MSVDNRWRAARAQYEHVGRIVYGWVTEDYPRTALLLETEPELATELERARDAVRSVYRTARGAWTDASRLRREGNAEGATQLLEAAAQALTRAARALLRNEQRILQRAQRAGISTDLAQGRYQSALRRMGRELRGVARNAAEAADGMLGGLAGGLLLVGAFVLASNAGGGRRR